MPNCWIARQCALWWPPVAGRLAQRDLMPLALADLDNTGTGRIADAAIMTALSPNCRTYPISLTGWAVGARDTSWRQVSRSGGNLVVQVNFPEEHDFLFYRYLNTNTRKRIEYENHPVRTTGTPTMAWVRLDICQDTGVALIEEVQSDWFRFVRASIRQLERAQPRTRHLRNLQSYEAQLLDQYGKGWAKVALLAALNFLRFELGIRDVFMHQPRTGAALKHIRSTQPPVSVYSKLPKAFCFQPSRDIPKFLSKPCSKRLRHLRRDPRPLFWRLQLG